MRYLKIVLAYLCRDLSTLYVVELNDPMYEVLQQKGASNCSINFTKVVELIATMMQPSSLPQLEKIPSLLPKFPVTYRAFYMA
jgi:hypothetical protein